MSIPELARLLHPSYCWEKVVAVLKFLGDETGTDKKPKTRISAVAGLIGGEKNWKKFDREWRKVLEALDVPYFHAVECEHGKGEFYGLDVARRGRIVDRLVGVILDSPLQPCAYGVVVPHFNEMSLDFRTHFTNGHPDIPYYLCLYHTFVSESHAADDLPQSEQVYFLFEKQDEFEADARAAFDEFKKGPHWPNHYRLGECQFISKEEDYKYPGLQAADLLAYEMYRHLDNRHFQPDLKPEWKVRSAFNALQTKLKGHSKYYDRAGLQLLETERTSGKYEALTK